MTTTVSELAQKGAAAKAAARQLARLGTSVKNDWLYAVAQALDERQEAVLEANDADDAEARHSGLPEAMLERMLLTPQRLAGMAADVRNVATLPDPVGEVIEMRTLPNGLQL